MKIFWKLSEDLCRRVVLPTVLEYTCNPIPCHSGKTNCIWKLYFPHTPVYISCLMLTKLEHNKWNYMQRIKVQEKLIYRWHKVPQRRGRELIWVKSLGRPHPLQLLVECQDAYSDSKWSHSSAWMTDSRTYKCERGISDKEESWITTSCFLNKVYSSCTKLPCFWNRSTCKNGGQWDHLKGPQYWEMKMLNRFWHESTWHFWESVPGSPEQVMTIV